MVVSFFLSMYYNVINAWAFWYLFHSFQVCGRPAECLSPMEGPGGVVSVLDILQSHHQLRGGTSSRNPPGSFLGEKTRGSCVPRGFAASSPHHKMWVEASPAMHCLHVAQQPQWAAAWGGLGLSKGRGEDWAWVRGSSPGGEVEDKL